MLIFLCFWIFAFFIKLAERSEDASKAIAAKRELRARVEEISKDYDEEKKLTFDITQDMTRQYKGMQEELLNRVSFDNMYTISFILLMQLFNLLASACNNLQILHFSFHYSGNFIDK